MRIVAALALATAAFLTGCAATVTRDAPASGTVLVSPAAARTVVLEIAGVGNIGAGEDWTAFLEEWQTSMAAAAASKGVSFTLAKPDVAMPAGPAVLVKMKVNDFRYVSQAKRYAIGVLAGNAFMDLDVEFVELPLLKTVGTRKFKTASSAWQGVFSAMTPKQVEAVSNEIISDVVGR
jgi:hypothetical protein